MLMKKIVVKNAAGLHARPSSMLVQLASKFESEFHIHMYGYRINAKSILGVMTLAAECGAELELELDGPDEKKAMKAIVELFESGFNEMQKEKSR
jgi:phosphocarrier protein HPr